MTKKQLFLGWAVLISMVVMVAAGGAGLYRYFTKPKAVTQVPQKPAQQGPVENIVGFYMAAYAKAKACTGIHVVVKEGDKKTAERVLRDKKLLAVGEAICGAFDCEKPCIPVGVSAVKVAQ